MMQAQLDRTRAETNAIRDVKERVETMLEGLGSLKIDADDADDGGDAGLAATARRRRREALAVWARENEVARLLDDEFA